MSFDGIETLRGEAKLDDLFVLKAGGSLSGFLDGAAEGFDTLS